MVDAGSSTYVAGRVLSHVQGEDHDSKLKGAAGGSDLGAADNLFLVPVGSLMCDCTTRLPPTFGSMWGMSFPTSLPVRLLAGARTC